MSAAGHPPLPDLSQADLKKFRSAIGAPDKFRWHDLLLISVMNPRQVKIEDSVHAEIDAVVARVRPLLDSLGREVADAMRSELESLHAAGQAIELRSGDDPFALVGQDVVYTMNLATETGLAASRRAMPRYQEADARRRQAGKDVALAVTNTLVNRNILTLDEAAGVDRLIREWQ